jgi:hypothetical protein
MALFRAAEAAELIRAFRSNEMRKTRPSLAMPFVLSNVPLMAVCAAEVIRIAMMALTGQRSRCS